MSSNSNPRDSLNRVLTSRHIQMIGLGGAIGTGLFLGSAGVIKSAGPSMLIGYALAGLVAFFMMRQLGEMLVDEPVSGSMGHFANKYISGFAGYLAGWNYVATYVLVAMAELTAVGKYLQFWWPDLPAWMTATVCFILINLLNLLNVKVFGEAEFWFSVVKVGAVIAMIVFGSWLLTTNAVPGAAFSNLWTHGGFVPNGLSGLATALPFIMFAFGGLEMIGFTAGEAQRPEKNIPRAINQVLWRIGIFYIGALSILLMLTPWNELAAVITAGGDGYSASPFVRMFSIINSNIAATVLNAVVLTAALSVYNSSVYCTTRQMHSLAGQGHAPRILLRLNRNKVPVMALAATALITGTTVILNYILPNGAMELLMSLTVSTIIINWIITSLAHLKFKKANRERSQYVSPWFPATNYACIIFVTVILITMSMMDSMRLSVFLIPLWILGLMLTYKSVNSAKREKQQTASTIIK